MRRCLPPVRPSTQLLLRDLLRDLARRPADWREAAGNLERTYATAHGGGEAILVPSGRDGLRFILCHLRRPGATTVIVPALGDTSVLEAIAAAGLTPKVCDVSADDGTMDPDQLQACIGPNVLAVLVVHTWGHAAALRQILAVTEAAGIPLIEDCAHAPAALGRNGYLGTFGVASFTSCAPFKSIDCGGGGIVLTRDPALATAVRTAAAKHPIASRPAATLRALTSLLLRVFSQPRVYDVFGHRLFVGVGGADTALVRYKRWIRPLLKRDADRPEKPLPSLAFLRSGLRQLEELPRRLELRQRLVRQLSHKLLSGLLILPEDGASAHYAVVVRTGDPRALLLQLGAQGVDAIASPMVRLGEPGEGPVADELASTAVQLPWFDDFDQHDVELLAAVLGHTTLH